MRFDDLVPGPAPQLPLRVFEARRRRVAEALGDKAALVVATHAPALHSNDVEHRFRPHSDFWYLTGFGEPGLLVLLGGTAETHLFLRERKAEAEIWNGRRLGVDRARDALGVDHAHALDQMAQRLAGITAGRTVHATVAHDPNVAETVANAVGETRNGANVVASFRCIKDADELALMQKANDVGIAAMEDSLQAIRPGGTEHEVESHLVAAYRRAGSTGPAYPPIVGAGANAAILHYIDNQAPIHDGDLVLIDAGCEWGHYASDITRTMAAGEASNLQRELHALVVDAQDAAIAKVRPGNTFRDPHDAAVRVLTEGLVNRGYLKGDVDKAIADESYRAFYMHGTSHFLGLDVHDAGATKGPDGESRLLEPGMVLTVEPGLYFNPDFASVPEGVGTMGIRIENDIVVTDDGCHDMTGALSRDLDALAR